MRATEASACRSCGSEALEPILDLGLQPLANALRHADDSEPESRFPLATVLCTSCSLVQLTVSVDPAVLFDTYHYFSSFSTTMLDAMGDLAGRFTRDLGLGDGDLVVEVASNDGYLLRQYLDLGVPVLGIDPAANVAEVAVERGVPTLVEFFGTESASRLRADGVRAQVLHANNVMAHVPDINDFVAGISLLLADDGVAVIETPYIADLVASVEFDTIYHEHVFYYSLTSVVALASRHGLVVSDVERLSIHGGSLRLQLRHGAASGPSRAVTDLLEEEAGAGISDPAYYAAFTGRVEELKQRTVRLLRRLHDGGARLAAYGGAAKGAVLLNHFGIDRQIIEVVVDRNYHKHGLMMPGVGIPIVGTERLTEDRPDYVLLLAWNFADEIIGQQKDYLDGGGAFIVPIPELRIVER